MKAYAKIRAALDMSKRASRYCVLPGLERKTDEALAELAERERAASAPVMWQYLDTQHVQIETPPPSDVWRALYAAPPVPAASFQQQVKPWMLETFGVEISSDMLERSDRFIEEALELGQSLGHPKERAHALIEYVYGRPVGEPSQEVGGVMVTLAALCLAAGLDMHEAAETELARIWTKIDVIREKQKSKPRGSALPVPTATPVPAGVFTANEIECAFRESAALWSGDVVQIESDWLQSSAYKSVQERAK